MLLFNKIVCKIKGHKYKRATTIDPTVKIYICERCGHFKKGDN